MKGERDELAARVARLEEHARQAEERSLFLQQRVEALSEAICTILAAAAGVTPQTPGTLNYQSVRKNSAGTNWAAAVREGADPDPAVIEEALRRLSGRKVPGNDHSSAGGR